MNVEIEDCSEAQERALVKRINRACADHLQLHVCRFDSRWFRELGRYYWTDDNRNIIERHADPVADAVELGVSLP